MYWHIHWFMITNPVNVDTAGCGIHVTPCVQKTNKIASAVPALRLNVDDLIYKSI